MTTIFNLGIEHADKPLSYHPWRKTIKPELEHKIGRAHNSVNNPEIPKKKEKRNKIPIENRDRFQVIGNRFTEEFIYCVKIVTGLHKYRWRKFEPPIIRGFY